MHHRDILVRVQTQHSSFDPPREQTVRFLSLLDRSDGIHILCMSESNIHKEIRSRWQFLLQVANKHDNSTRILLLLHDCWLPFLEGWGAAQRMVHLDLPLMEEVLLARLSLLGPNTSTVPNSLFFVSSTQTEALKLFHSTHAFACRKVAIPPSVSKWKAIVEKYVRKHGEEPPNTESVRLDDLTEDEAHQLFYQNSKPEVVPCDHRERVVIPLDTIDTSGLEEVEASCVERSWVVDSVFNPFLNPCVTSLRPFSIFLCSVCLTRSV